MLLRDPKLRAARRTTGSRSSRSGASRSPGLLSGGEQQMLSLAPALADPPKVLIADEPTLGLAPLAAETVMQAIVELRDAGTAVLLVEEHAQNALKVADTLAFMELGRIVWMRSPRRGRHGAARERLPRQREPLTPEHIDDDATAYAPASRTARDPAAVVDALREHGAVLVDEMIDGATVAAINREVDDAVAAAEPGQKTVNDGDPGVLRSPHQARVVPRRGVTHVRQRGDDPPDVPGRLRRDPPPAVLALPLNLGHLIVRGPGARGADPAPRRGRVAALPAAARRHPDRVDPRPRRLPRRERRDARRARKPSLGARPPTRARRDRRRGGPCGRRGDLPRLHDPLRGHELDRRRVAARRAHQLHARLAAHRGEQRARRPAADRADAHDRTRRRCSATRSTTRSPTAAGTSAWCTCATRWSCSRPASSTDAHHAMARERRPGRSRAAVSSNPSQVVEPWLSSVNLLCTG